MKNLVTILSRRSILRFLTLSVVAPVRDLFDPISLQGNPNQGLDSISIEHRLSEVHAFLTNEMDRWSSGTVVYDDSDSGAAGYYPSGWMGDLDDLHVDDSRTDSPAEGDTYLRIAYTPSGPCKWAGIYWDYPDHNWGEFPGRALTGAREVSFWARAGDDLVIVEFTIGGVNRHPHKDPSKPFEDSLRPLTKRLLLTKSWRQYKIEIPRRTNLESVIGGFCVVISRSYNPFANTITIDLDGVRFNDAKPAQLRLIRSYVPDAPPNDSYAIRNAAFLYDNAVAVLALLALGDDDSLIRARLLTDSIVWAQEHDRSYRDGGWRTAMSCGPLEDWLTHTARLPGWYDKEAKPKPKWNEDEYAVSRDTGNNAWAILSCLATHDCFFKGRHDSPYLQAALKAARWIEACFRINDEDRGGYGGYSGGFQGWETSEANPDGPKTIWWRSTEHILDVYVAFSQLASITHDDNWSERAGHAKRFVLRMWNPDGGHFWTGVDPYGNVNKTAIPIDIQSWIVMGMGHDQQLRETIDWSEPTEIPACMKWVEKYARSSPSADCQSAKGYRFSESGTGLWFEGAAHLASAYAYIGDTNSAHRILSEILGANPGPNVGSSTTGARRNPEIEKGILAACPDQIKTGFMTETSGKIVDRTYPRLYHIGASAWFILAALGKNPYWLNGPPTQH